MILRKPAPHAPASVPPPALDRFTPAERRLIRRLRTPAQVQRWLNRMPYNTEPGGDTLRGFRQVVRRGTAHCLEAALTAAAIMEQHGYPPLLLGLDSIDGLDHVIVVYRHRGRWGSVACPRAGTTPATRRLLFPIPIWNAACPSRVASRRCSLTQAATSTPSWRPRR